MLRLVAMCFLVGSCGPKLGASLCDNQVPPPAACGQACDPAQASCPAGFHCSSGGTCDTACTPGGTECGAGATCTTDGYCEPTGSGSGGPDASCPAVHFAAMPTTPSIQLLIDRSGSMSTDLGGGVSRYQAIRDGLVGTGGVVTALQSKVYFGASLFTADSPCPRLYDTPTRTLNNLTAIQTLIDSQSPGGDTPTPPSIDKTVAAFLANPPPAGSPPIILLATDGLPNQCGSTTDTSPQSVVAAKAAYAAGIKLYIVGIAGVANQFLQDMANAGQGVVAPQPNAMYYTANSPASLATAFQQIIGGVLSCDLAINGHVDPATAGTGTVTLDGVVLHYGTDWTIDPSGTTIHIIGAACTTLKNDANPVVDASFACGSVIP